jgi:type VI secretion system protein ImpM
MKAVTQPGVFGKLPMHGDFIQRNLPANFISVWDEWMQYYIAGSKEQLGEEWLDIYLTSPIWRFVFSPGVIDENRWAGILMPSVDQVGRYYPFSVVIRLPDEINPIDFVSAHADWYASIEELALQALDGQFMVDELIEQLSGLELNFMSNYVSSGRMLDANSIQINMDFEEQSPMSIYPYILDSLLVKSFSSYSVWTTRGSERIAPCLFGVQGLPSVSKIPAMLDGQWLNWGWPQTYLLKH